MGLQSEKPTLRTLAVVVAGTALAAMFAPPPVGPGPAYADECSDLRAAIQQLDRQIADMGSAGRTGGGSGGQVGAYQDARNNYVNAYNSMNCANGGLSRGGGSGGGVYVPQNADPGLAALGLGLGILDNMINNDRERSRQAAIAAEARRQAEYRRQQAERQRQEAERLLAAQRAREADDAMRMAMPNAFGPNSAPSGDNPFAAPFVQSSGGTLVAPNERAAQDALSRPVMQDLSAHGVRGCPTGEPLVNYCSIKPDWWEHQAAGTYSQQACVTYVQAATSSTQQCELRYRSTLARSQAEVRSQAAEVQHQQRCADNPFLEECQD